MVFIKDFSRGINNVEGGTAIARETARNGQMIKSKGMIVGGEFRELINVVIRNDGYLERRRGFTRVKTGSYDSLFSHNGIMYYRKNSQLMTSEDEAICAVKGVCRYDTVGDDIYFTDENYVYLLRGKTATKLGIMPFSDWSTSNINGNLAIGKHLIAITNYDGVNESTPIISIIDVTTGGIKISYGASQYRRRVYMSNLGGSELHLVAELGVPSGTVDIGSYGDGVYLNTDDLVTPVGGDSIAVFANRLFIGNGDVVQYSQPFMYHRFQEYGFMRFESPVTMLGNTTLDVLYIGTEKAIHRVRISPEGMSSERVANFGALKDSFVNFGNSELNQNLGIVGAFLSEKGIIVIQADGSMQNVTVGRYKYSGKIGIPLYYREEGKEFLLWQLRG